MKVIKSYAGYIGNVYAIVCDNIPEGMKVEKESTVIHPDDGKIFFKDGMFINEDIVLGPDEKPEDYQEIDIPNF